MTPQILDAVETRPGRWVTRPSLPVRLSAATVRVRTFVWLAGVFAVFTPLAGLQFGWGWQALLGAIASAGSAVNAWLAHKVAGQGGA